MNESLFRRRQVLSILIALLTLVPQCVSADEQENLQELVELQEQVRAFREEGNHRQAVETAQTLLKRAEESFSDDPQTMALALTELASLYYEESRYREAEPLVERSLAILEDEYGPDHPDVVGYLAALARVYIAQKMFDKAEPLLKRSLTIQEKTHGPEHPDVASSLFNLAVLRNGQQKFDQAEALLQRSLSILEKAHGPEHTDVAQVLITLATFYGDRTEYDKAERLLLRSLSILEKVLGPDHPDVTAPIIYLANVHSDQANYDQAEQFLQRSITILEKSRGPEHPSVADSQQRLADLYTELGKYAEAEAIYQKLISQANIVDIGTAYILNNLANSYRARGRYYEAERSQRRALQIKEEILGRNSNPYASSLVNLSRGFIAQQRFEEATRLLDEALEIFDQISDFDQVAWTKKIYGNLHLKNGNPEEAIALLRQSADSPAFTVLSRAELHLHLADALSQTGQYSEAQELIRQEILPAVSALGENHPVAGRCHHLLAKCHFKTDEYAAAEDHIDQAVAIQDRAGVSTIDRFASYFLRAEISWEQSRRNEAVSDLQRALALAEQARVHFSGSELERAIGFAQFFDGFERMIVWQQELQNMSEVLATIEKARVRTLLEDMVHARADLHAGRSTNEREAIQQQELDLKQQIAVIEKQLERDGGSTDLHTKLAAARQALYDHYRDERNSSPVYRNLLSTGAGPPRLSQLQRVLAADGSLVLIYLLGDEGSYLLSIDSTDAELAVLEVDESAAETLGIEAGPLNAERFGAAMNNDQRTGVMQRLSSPETAGDARDQLAALWTMLVPAELRQRITDGAASAAEAGDRTPPIRRLVVIPDGPLSLLPFETLVIDPRASDPTYLLDVGPPIHYSPSATVLYNLVQRRTADSNSGGPQLLTVGDPSYSNPGEIASNSDDAVLDVLTPRSRYDGLGGQLRNLPNSGIEVRWISSVFDKAGVSAVALTGPNATEAGVRSELAGRRFVHLACHGLVDHNFGNLFGALAFSVGSNASQKPDDDGFLTLAEMHGLDLNACELAILSACQTNYGPQQKGEGVWAISRGFLVAGARRVVASNWLVDDEAAASLVSYFCGGVANAIGKEQDPDYAGSLQAAKRWVRNQEKWSSPYYWGTFVLVGPE